MLCQDIVQISKKISLHLALKEIESIKDNFDDPLYVQRMETFRNLQVRDAEFARKKEKIFWPLLQLPLNNNLMVTKQSTKNKALPSENKLGKNTDLVNKLNKIK